MNSLDYINTDEVIEKNSTIRLCVEKFAYIFMYKHVILKGFDYIIDSWRPPSLSELTPMILMWG